MSNQRLPSGDNAPEPALDSTMTRRQSLGLACGALAAALGLSTIESASAEAASGTYQFRVTNAQGKIAYVRLPTSVGSALASGQLLTFELLKGRSVIGSSFKVEIEGLTSQR